jgi:hypothetical protein
LGGLVEQDPNDQYGLARDLLHPLRPWFREVNYHGPIQVTAVRRGRKMARHRIQYPHRRDFGGDAAPDAPKPLQVVLQTGRNQPLQLRFVDGLRFGCSLTLAGYGYPYVQVRAAVSFLWKSVRRSTAMSGGMRWPGIATGFCAARPPHWSMLWRLEKLLDAAIALAYSNIRKIRSLGSYYRPDIGQSLWPPGNS